MVLFYFSVISIFSYLFSLTPFVIYLPQLIAFLSILFVIFIQKKISTIYLISMIVNLIIFSQNGVHSPVFFLIYFLLFVVAFQQPPSISLFYSLITAILLSSSTNSYISLLPIFSLLFITPIVWFISRQNQTIAMEETDFLFWLNLKFKTGITVIIDLASQLQSSPLSYTQKEQVKKIKDSAKSLLNSSRKLSDEI